MRTHVLHAHALAASGTGPICDVGGGLALAAIASSDVFLVAAVRGNANIMMALEWLQAVRTPAGARTIDRCCSDPPAPAIASAPSCRSSLAPPHLRAAAHQEVVPFLWRNAHRDARPCS